MVVIEAVKQAHNLGEEPGLYFFRDQNGREIDLLVERDRRLRPIEIKASLTWNAEFAKQLRWFKALSPRAERGMVVYGGDLRIESEDYEAVPFQEALSSARGREALPSRASARSG
jgi:hypothetical protein